MKEVVLASTVLSTILIFNNLTFSSRIGIIIAYFLIGVSAMKKFSGLIIDGDVLETSTVVLMAGMLLLLISDRRKKY